MGGRVFVCLTTQFASVHGRKLGSPWGRAGAKRLRGEAPSTPLRHILTLAKTGPLAYNKIGDIYPDG